MKRKDLDPDQLANLLRALQSIYDEYDVTRCSATTFNASGGQCPCEIRFNITVRWRRPG
jgi:hypothetical protein